MRKTTLIGILLTLVLVSVASVWAQDNDATILNVVANHHTGKRPDDHFD